MAVSALDLYELARQAYMEQQSQAVSPATRSVLAERPDVPSSPSLIEQARQAYQDPSDLSAPSSPPRSSLTDLARQAYEQQQSQQNVPARYAPDTGVSPETRRVLAERPDAAASTVSPQTDLDVPSSPVAVQRQIRMPPGQRGSDLDVPSSPPVQPTARRGRVADVPDNTMVVSEAAAPGTDLALVDAAQRAQAARNMGQTGGAASALEPAPRRSAGPAPPGAPGDYGAAGLEPAGKPQFTDPMSGAPMKAPSAPYTDSFGEVVKSIYNPPPTMPAESATSRAPVNFQPAAQPADQADTRGKAREAEAQGAPGATAVAPAPAPAPVPKPAVKKYDTKGAPGGGALPRDATEQPVMNERVPISPRAFVDMEKTDPAMYQNVSQVAATVAISPWALTNLMYAARGTPGGIGLTGIKEEDVARYRAAMPELFRDPQGNPISPYDPHLNLILGAMKYKEVSDRYGRDTSGALHAYFGDPGTVDAAARRTGPEQQALLSPTTKQVQTFANPDKPGSVTVPPVNSSGSMTAQGVGTAMQQAAQEGEPRLTAQYMVHNMPRGMSSTDGWRAVEALLVSAFIAKGDMEGAHRAREMVFQQSQVGATQSLMRADALLRAGDAHGAARALSQAYFFVPDGGQAKVYVNNKNQVWTQRYNEDTGEAVGHPFQVTPETIAPMLNVTRDPQAYMKFVREEQKAHADIAMKQAHADYYRMAPAVAAMKEAGATGRAAAHDVAAMQRTIEAQNAANARLQAGAQYRYTQAVDVADIHAGGAGGKGAVPSDVAISKEIGDLSMVPGTVSPDFSVYYTAFRRNGVPGEMAKDIASNIGSYEAVRMSDGTVGIRQKGGESGTPGPVRVKVPPEALRSLSRTPTQLPRPTSPIGAAATAAGG